MVWLRFLGVAIKITNHSEYILERSTDWNRFSDEELLNAGDIAQYLGTNTIIQSDDVLIDHLVEDMAEIIAPQSVGMIDSQEVSFLLVQLRTLHSNSNFLLTVLADC